MYSRPSHKGLHFLKPLFALFFLCLLFVFSATKVYGTLPDSKTKMPCVIYTPDGCLYTSRPLVFAGEHDRNTGWNTVLLVGPRTVVDQTPVVVSMDDAYYAVWDVSDNQYKYVLKLAQKQRDGHFIWEELYPSAIDPERVLMADYQKRPYAIVDGSELAELKRAIKGFSKSVEHAFMTDINTITPLIVQEHKLQSGTYYYTNGILSTENDISFIPLALEKRTKALGKGSYHTYKRLAEEPLRVSISKDKQKLMKVLLDKTSGKTGKIAIMHRLFQEEFRKNIDSSANVLLLANIKQGFLSYTYATADTLFLRSSDIYRKKNVKETTSQDGIFFTEEYIYREWNDGNNSYMVPFIKQRSYYPNTKDYTKDFIAITDAEIIAHTHMSNLSPNSYTKFTASYLMRHYIDLNNDSTVSMEKRALENFVSKKATPTTVQPRLVQATPKKQSKIVTGHPKRPSILSVSDTSAMINPTPTFVTLNGMYYGVWDIAGTNDKYVVKLIQLLNQIEYVQAQPLDLENLRAERIDMLAHNALGYRLITDTERANLIQKLAKGDFDRRYGDTVDLLTQRMQAYHDMMTAQYYEAILNKDNLMITYKPVGFHRDSSSVNWGYFSVQYTVDPDAIPLVLPIYDKNGRMISALENIRQDKHPSQYIEHAIMQDTLQADMLKKNPNAKTSIVMRRSGNTSERQHHFLPIGDATIILKKNIVPMLLSSMGKRFYTPRGQTIEVATRFI